jgi:ferredoxin
LVTTDGRFLATDNVAGFLTRLGATCRVFAPVRVSDTVVRFEQVNDDTSLVLDAQAASSPKNVLFPQTECLFTYTYKKDPEDLAHAKVQVNETLEAVPTVVFGARPCDARGFVIFDQVFANGPWTDPYYVARRDATTIVTILCTAPEPTCFCDSVGGGPTSTEGTDLALTPVDGGYYAEAFTEKGRRLLNDEAFTPAGGKTEQARAVQEHAARTTVLVLEGIAERVHKLFNTDFWRDITATCISCGTCTYVCPTCYCFNITDEATGTSGERLRTWDSCMFHHYTLEASGHNPRPTKAERYRNRIGHKFSYHPDNYEGVYACTGCGRCIKMCPVSLDIRHVLREAQTYE